MANVMWKWGSIWRGLRAMKRDRAHVNWTIRWQEPPRMWWAHCWTPVWHEGRGPYLTVGLGAIAVMRGY